MEDLFLPTDLKQLNEHSRTLVMEFPKLDQIAEIALRKYRVRGVGNMASAGDISSGPSPLRN